LREFRQQQLSRRPIWGIKLLYLSGESISILLIDESNVFIYYVHRQKRISYERGMAMDFETRLNVYRKRKQRKKDINKLKSQFEFRSVGYERFQRKLREHLTGEDIFLPGTKAEIWMGGYLIGKCFYGFKHPADGKIYTNEYRAITEHVSPCRLYVTGKILEMQKGGLPEEARGFEMKSGYVDAVELISTMENTCGYYVKDNFNVNGVQILDVPYEPLSLKISGKTLKGYMRNGIKCLMLESLRDFSYCIGTYKPAGKGTVHNYLLADIYDRKLRFEGLTFVSAPLEYYNVLDVEYILKKCSVEGEGYEYVITSSDFKEDKGVHYAEIKQKCDIK